MVDIKADADVAAAATDVVIGSPTVALTYPLASFGFGPDLDRIGSSLQYKPGREGSARVTRLVITICRYGRSEGTKLGPGSRGYSKTRQIATVLNGTAVVGSVGRVWPRFGD